MKIDPIKFEFSLTEVETCLLFKSPGPLQSHTLYRYLHLLNWKRLPNVNPSNSRLLKSLLLVLIDSMCEGIFFFKYLSESSLFKADPTSDLHIQVTIMLPQHTKKVLLTLMLHRLLPSTSLPLTFVLLPSHLSTYSSTTSHLHSDANYFLMTAKEFQVVTLTDLWPPFSHYSNAPQILLPSA